MRHHNYGFATSIVILGLLQVSAFARHLESWPYKRLFKESDCIVLANAMSTENSRDSFIDKRWPYEFDGMNTTFEIKHVLKGKGPGKTIRVVHFKFGKLRQEVKDAPGNLVLTIDGPNFVGFRTEPASMKGTADMFEVPQPEYMLFLRKLEDGRFEPVSGKIDPQLSVREVFEPLSTELGGSQRDK